MELSQFFKTFNLSEDEISLMETFGKSEIYQSGDAIPYFYGHNVDHFYFVKKGITRSYRIIEGDDFTYNFFLTGELGTDLESYLKKTPSQHYFEALSPTEIIVFRFSNIVPLFDEYPRIQRIALKLAESGFLRVLERMKEFQSDSLEQRYLNLIEKHEELFLEAPLQHIASYLGVKPQSLSRIRSKITKK